MTERSTAPSDRSRGAVPFGRLSSLGKGVTYLLLAGVLVLVGFWLLLLSWGMALVIGPAAGLLSIPVVLVMGYGVAPPAVAESGSTDGTGDRADTLAVHLTASVLISPFWFMPSFVLWDRIEPIFISDLVGLAAAMLAGGGIFFLGFTAGFLAIVRLKYGPLRRRYVEGAVVVSVAYAMAYCGLMYAGLTYL